MIKAHLMIAAIVLAAIITGLVSIHYMGNDNPIEEVAEEIIEKEIGVKIDLSPEVKK